MKTDLELTFDVQFSGEPAAGLCSYTDTVLVSLASGDPDGSREFSEFAERMRQAIAEWFDGASVTLHKVSIPARQLYLKHF